MGAAWNSIAPDTSNIQRGFNILQWIPLNQKHICVQPICKSPTISKLEPFGDHTRCRTKGLFWGHPNLMDIQVQFMMDGNAPACSHSGSSRVAPTTIVS